MLDMNIHYDAPSEMVSSFNTEVENLHFLSGGGLTSPCSEFKGVIENQECSPEKFDHLVPLD